ncbi:MAG: NAD-dependent deacylase [Chlorobi bacterium]|nr:NAD-dependent deacylase [Chlorobiota bacterium]
MADDQIKKAATLIRESKYTSAFTGAGISVESGIPPFRGEEGLWSKYDPKTLEIDFFYRNPKESWKVIMEIFYEFFGKATPNRAHEVLAELEKRGLLKSVITQNIDNLHQEAGSRVVYEFHGNSKKLVCTFCNAVYSVGELSMDVLPVRCPKCNMLVKPDFIFFGEAIPQDAYNHALEAARNSQVMLVIGTTAEVMPAGQIPIMAKSNGATIIEVNREPSNLTGHITDIFLQGKASVVMDELLKNIIKT